MDLGHLEIKVGVKRMPELSHVDAAGRARRVDVSEKQQTARRARAAAFVAMPPEVIAAMPENKKGNPLEVARFAGIQAAKKTSDLIPMCHPLPISFADVRIEETEGGLRIESEVRTVAGTGVEMEALTAAAVAALTIYDMTKAASKAIDIRHLQLLEKTGGKSGNFRRQDE